jgi:hypothetical protein
MSPKTVAIVKWVGSLVAALCTAGAAALVADGSLPVLAVFLGSTATGLTAWLHAPVPEALETKIAKAEALVDSQASK